MEEKIPDLFGKVNITVYIFTLNVETSEL